MFGRSPAVAPSSPGIANRACASRCSGPDDGASVVINPRRRYSGETCAPVPVLGVPPYWAITLGNWCAGRGVGVIGGWCAIASIALLRGPTGGDGGGGRKPAKPEFNPKYPGSAR